MPLSLGFFAFLLFYQNNSTLMDYGASGYEDVAGDEDYVPEPETGDTSPQGDDEGPDPASPRPSSPQSQAEEDPYAFPSEAEESDGGRQKKFKRKKPASKPRKRADAHAKGAKKPGKPKPAAKGFGPRTGPTSNRGANTSDDEHGGGGPRPPPRPKAFADGAAVPPHTTPSIPLSGGSTSSSSSGSAPAPSIKPQRKRPRMEFPARKPHSTFSVFARPSPTSFDFFDSHKHSDDTNPNSIRDEMTKLINSAEHIHPTELVNSLTDMYYKNVIGEDGDEQGGANLPKEIDPHTVEHAVLTRMIPVSAMKMTMMRGNFYMWMQSMKKGMYIGPDGEPEATDFAFKITAHAAAVMEKLNKIK